MSHAQMAFSGDAKSGLPPPRQWRCSECGREFVSYADPGYPERNVCDAQACTLSAIRKEGPYTVPVPCSCPQRPYPHDPKEVHHKLRRENPGTYIAVDAHWEECPVRFAESGAYWPWSLMLSEKVEAGT